MIIIYVAVGGCMVSGVRNPAIIDHTSYLNLYMGMDVMKSKRLKNTEKNLQYIHITMNQKRTFIFKRNDTFGNIVKIRVFYAII